MYRCGTCGSAGLRLIASGSGWDVACLNGHPLVPIVGTEIVVEGSEALDDDDGIEPEVGYAPGQVSPPGPWSMPDPENGA